MGDNLNSDNDKRTFSEELEVTGNQLVERVKELIEEGNVRRLIIRNQEGHTLLEIPLTMGAVAGGVLVFLYPLLGVVAIGVGLVARIKIEIIREVIDGDTIEKPKVESTTTKNDLDGE